MSKQNTFVYSAYGNIYFNLTNRCDNNCDFCIRNNHEGVEGNSLWIDCEPTLEDVLMQLPSDLSCYKEAVFCGYGEPTYQIDLMEKIAKVLKCEAMNTRLDTNGHGNLINGYDITPKLSDIDTISVSLNGSNPKIYQESCKCVYGEEGYTEMIDFAKKCKERGHKVFFSIVDIVGDEEIKRCQEIADKHNITLRVRKYE